MAGNDTTRQTSRHALKALTDHPEQRAWLMADFDARIDGAVEEFVRWASPVMSCRFRPGPRVGFVRTVWAW